MFLRICGQRGTEALQIRKAKLVHDRQHLGLIALHLIKPDLMNLGCRLIQASLFVECEMHSTHRR